MTREKNSGLSAEGESVAYPFNADNQVKPDWHNNWANRPDRWCICTCDGCNECKPKERVLDDWIKPFFDNCCKMEKVGR